MTHLRRVLKRLAPLLLLPLTASAQSFQQPAVIPTGNWPDAVYSADLNGDGYPDLIYIDHGATPQASTTHVLLNDGKGNFTRSATLATAGNSLAIGDMTGSGHVDIGWIYSGPSNYLTVYFAPGKGDGTFAALQTQVGGPGYAAPGIYEFLVAARLHATGPLDLVAMHSNLNQIIDVYKRPGYYDIDLSAPLLDGSGPITITDLNQDGFNDLVIYNRDKSTVNTVLRSKYETFFNSVLVFAPPAGVHSLLIQDVNQDGRPDLIAEGANGHIDVFPGSGDGTFQSTSIGGTGPLDGRTGNGGRLIASVDLNHDGLLDALTVTPAGISTLLGNGTAYLGLNGIFNGGPTGQSGHPSYAIADFNHDGSLDLAVDSPEGIAILFGNPDGTFQTSRAYAAGVPAAAGTVGVFSASGHLDAFVSPFTGQGQILSGRGDGTFSPLGGGSPPPILSAYSDPNFSSTVQLGEFDAAHLTDILLTANGVNPVLAATHVSGLDIAFSFNGLYSNFQPVLTSQSPACSLYPPPFVGQSAIADFNGDGTSDIANRDASGLHIILGSPTLLTAVPAQDVLDNSVSCDTHAHQLVTTGLFGASHTPDVIYQRNGSLLLELNDGHGHFSAAPIGDLSVDGSLTTPGQRTAPTLFPLYGGFVSAASGGLDTTAVLAALTTADLDRDGNTDLLALYANFAADPKAPSPANPNYIYIWFGDGTGHFPTSARHPVNPVRFSPSRNYDRAALADLNRDGIPDLILTDGYLISVQLGKGDGTFGSETHYLAGQGINSLSTVDLRGIGQNDLVLANGGAYLSNPAANRDLPLTNPDVNTGGVTVLLNNAPPFALLPLPGSVTASPEPSSFGTDFYTTVLFTPPANSPAPTGTVTFSLDGTPIGTVKVNYSGYTGVDYPAPNTLAVGPHTITAAYSGDTTYAPAAYTAIHVVTAAAVNGSITAAPEPSAPGQPFTLIATGFGAGNFTFSVDGTVIGSVTSTTADATFPGPTSIASGTHTIAVSWTATASALARIATGTHVVTPLTRSPTSLALVLCVDDPGSLFPCATPLAATPLKSPVSMYYGQILDGSATESPTLLTGSTNFLDGNRVFCTINAALPPGMTTCPPTAGMFHAGSRIVTAAYSGDALNSPSTSNQIAVNVLPDLTTGLLTSSGSPTVQGTPVTFTFKVSGNFATPTGATTFSDGNTPIGTATLDVNGVATLTTSSLAVGPHTINATYAGTPDFNPLLTPASVLQIVTSPSAIPTLSPTTVTLVASGPTTILFNQPAFSIYNVIVVDPRNHPAYGTITVQDNGVNVPICTNIPVYTTCPYAAGGNLSVGVHSITLQYNGDVFNAPAISPPVVFTVLAATPVITIVSSSNPAAAGTPVTFTATFTGILGANFTGSLSFYDGLTLLGTQTLSSTGIATLTTTSLSVGTHPITAQYPSSGNFLAASSPTLSQLITTPAAGPPASFTLTVTPNPITLAVGHTGALLVTVTTPPGFAQTIILSCSGLPTQSTCTFLQPIIPVTGGSTTLQLAITAPHNCGDLTHPYFIGTSHLPFGPSSPLAARAAVCFFPAALLLTFGLTRTRRRLRALALTLLLATVSALCLTTISGCGACTDLGTRPGRYTFNVTATPQQAASAPAPASQPVNLTINLP